MLFFLRQIRRKLMSENKIGTYLLYAIGEIILVVVGILIAVQIDHWSDNKQQREKERAYLEDIKRSLEEDVEKADRVLTFNQMKEMSLDSILIKMQGPNYQQMFYSILKHIEPTFEFDLLILKRVAFDNMVAAESISLISDRTLREILSEYYTFENITQERVKLVSREYIDLLSPKLMRREIVKMVGYDLPIQTSPSYRLNEDPIIINLMLSLLNICKTQDELVIAKKEEATSLIQLIDEELKRK